MSYDIRLTFGARLLADISGRGPKAPEIEGRLCRPDDPDFTGSQRISPELSRPITKTSSRRNEGRCLLLSVFFALPRSAAPVDPAGAYAETLDG